MIDRNVEFPNRFRMTKVDGTDDIYDLIPAPGEVIALGDTFSKVNMLPDYIPKLLGLKMPNPQVADALNVLAHVGNLHVWERVLTTIDASYVERRVNISDANIFSSDYQSSRYYARFNVSDSINITSSGDISLVSPTQVEIYFQSDALYNFDSLKGKYISYVSTASNSSSSFPGSGNIGYISSDAEVSITYSNYYQAKITSGAYKVYSVFVPAGTTTDYLTSTDRNAYPDESTDGSDAYYTLGAAGYLNFYYSENDGAVTWKYSSSISVDADGTVSLVSPSRTEMMADNTGVSSANNLKGKFVLLSAKSNYTDATHGVIYYIPADATISYQVSSTTPWYIQTNKAQPVHGHAAIPANTTITYLGQLGGGARIEVGSYVGTGTYGSSNPNSLTFGFEPKVVMLLFISGPVYEQNYAPTIYSLFQGSAYNPVMVTSMLTNSPQPNVGFMYNSNGGTNTYNYAWISSDKRTIYWYNTQGSIQQFNGMVYQNIPNTYHYVAIG